MPRAPRFCPLPTMVRVLAETDAPSWSHPLGHGHRNFPEPSMECLILSAVVAPTHLSRCISWKQPPGKDSGRPPQRKWMSANSMGEDSCQSANSDVQDLILCPCFSDSVTSKQCTIVSNFWPCLALFFHFGITLQSPGYTSAVAYPDPLGFGEPETPAARPRSKVCSVLGIA